MRTQSVELTVNVTFRDDYGTTGTEVADMVRAAPDAWSAIAALEDIVSDVERHGEVCGTTFLVEEDDNI